MGKSQLQTALADWNKRVSKYAASGVPQAAYLPIAQHDLTRTYQQDSTPMTNAEADVAVYAAATHRNPIPQAPRHRSGFFGGLDTVLSNIIPDAGNIITSLPRGLATLGKDIVTPSQWAATGKDLATALSDVGKGDIGGALRSTASSPFLSLIPGVADAADLTTAAGRKALEEHPVTAALDVLPLAKPLTAGAGVLAAGSRAGELSDALRSGLETARPLDAIRGKVNVTHGLEGDPSALAAMVAGRPVLAAARGLDRTLTGREDPLTGQTLGVGQRTVRRILDRAKLDAKNQALSTALNQGKLAAEAQVKELGHTTLDKVFSEFGDDANTVHKIAAYTEKAANGDIAHMTPEELAVHDKVSVLRAQLEDRHTSQGTLVRTEEGLYPSDHPVVRAHRSRDVAATKHQKNVDAHTAAHDRLTAAKARQASAVQASTQIMSMLHLFRADTRSAVRERALRVVRKANTEYKRASVAAEKTANTAKQSGVALQKASDTLQRKIIRNPPPHLHEWIRNDFRQRALNAYTSGKGEEGIDLKDARELTVKSEYNQVLKDIATTPIMDRFYDYLGKDQAKELFADSVQEALKLTQHGMTPMYVHRLRDPDMESILSVHIAREQDLTESQVRKRAFNMESSVLNLRASLTREMINTIERDGMQQVYDNALVPFQKTRTELQPIYHAAAEKIASKRVGVSVDHLATTFLEEEWTKFSFEQFGLQRPGTVGRSEDIYIPKSMADNLQSFSKDGGGLTSMLSQSRGYNRVMRVFRTSVLYGPRHFAHVVIGGIMPVLLDSPTALLEARHLTGFANQLFHGETPNLKIGDHTLPSAIASHFDYKEDAGYKHLQTKIGNKYGELLKDFWGKTGKRFGDGMAQIENTAQSLYQATVYLHDIKKGTNPITALEHARSLVVNLDTLSPFERTVLKQVFPFYSFTRFATKFLVQLPFDHPLRVAILSQLSNQAQEEWGTGLPQTMMSLFFIGSPDAKGNIETINFRNANPFRSISSMFTMSGFMMSLNPILQAPFIAAGFNPLSGSGQLYPDIVYNAQTGTLTAARPKGDVMTAAESFVPELGAVDAYFGISDNLRTLKSTDQGAFDRELLNMFNIPFAASQYNLPQTRAKVAENAYKGAQNALTAFKKGGDYQDTIGRYALVPYQGKLIPSEQFKQYWDEVTSYYKKAAPGVDPAALLPTTTSTLPSNTLQELVNYYSSPGAR